MNYKTLRKILLSSNIQVLIITIIVFGMGTAMLLYASSDSFGGSVIGLSLFGGLFFFLAIVLFYKFLPALYGALSGSDPLLKALRENEKDYLVWVYRKQIDTTLGNGGSTIGTSNNVVVYNKEGNMIELVLAGNRDPEEVILFLADEFDIPYLGYTDDNRNAINENYYPRGWQKV
jgi:hypothetical protein